MIETVRLDDRSTGAERAAESTRRRLNRAKPHIAANKALINLMPALALGCSLTVLGLAAKRSWDNEVANAEAEVRQLAAAGAEYGARTLENFALVASRINDHLSELGGLPADQLQHRAHDQLARLTGTLRQPVIAFALDRDGFPLAASHIGIVPRTVSLADRDFFQALSRPDAPATYLSRMFVGRFDDRLLVAISQARFRAGASGPQFDGLATISVDPNLIGEGLRRLVGRPDDTLSLVRADGEFISASVRHDGPLPPEGPGSPFYRYASAESPAANYLAPIGGQAGDRFVAMRKLDGFPAYAVATRPRAEVRADAFNSIGMLLFFGLPATAALVLMSLRIRREHFALREANAALQLDIAQSADRLERAQRYALVGTFEVDLRSGASYRSPEYMGMHGKHPVAAREVHADWVRRLHPDDRRVAEARFLAAIDDDSDVTEYAQTYRVISAAGEVRWIAARGVIERDEAGRALVLRGVHADVTTLRAAEAALHESDVKLRLTQEAVEIDNWEWSPATGGLHLGRKARELLGFGPESSAPGWRQVLRQIHRADRQMLIRAVRAAFAGTMLRVEFRVADRSHAGPARLRWVMARARYLQLRNGQDEIVVGIAYDITDRKQVEERAAMLAREVEHRSKNLITIALGMVRLTEAPTAEALRDALEGRLTALSQTINLLSRSRWTGANLHALVLQELAPYFPDSGAADLVSGPHLTLAPDVAQSLSMALHELTTNAAKYGALSSDAGKVRIAWRVVGGNLRLTWSEEAGPTVLHVPDREGFGTSLIQSAIEVQLRGTVVRHWAVGGLRCEIEFPIEQTPEHS